MAVPSLTTGTAIGEPLLRTTRDGRMKPVETPASRVSRARRRPNHTKVDGAIGEPLVSDEMMQSLNGKRVRKL